MTTTPSAQRASKDARLNVRLAPSQAALIRLAAEVNNTSVSEFVISSAAEAADRVLADRRWFGLDDATWDAFEALLERPVVERPRLADLLTSDDRFVD
jgi:uncharacterized protein (DUF1778 family)